MSTPQTFIFRWTVYGAGYEWLDGPDGKLRLYPRVAPGVRIAHYTPETGLYRVFASLGPTKDGIREFAETYGDLFDRWDFMYSRVSGGLMVGGTSIDRWKVKIEDMRELVDLWDQIQDEKRHSELEKVIVRTDKEVCYIRGGGYHPLARVGEPSRFDPRDTVSYALCALQWEINRRLSDTETPCLVVPRLTWTPDTRPHQRITFQSSNLLAEMWMRFAQTIAGDFRLKQCAACPKYFQVGPGGRRSHMDTCSARCRQARSRNNRDKDGKSLLK